MHTYQTIVPCAGKRRSVIAGGTLALAILALLMAPSLSAQGLVDGFTHYQGETTVALSYSHESYKQYFVGTELAKNLLTGETPDPSNPNLGKITTQSVNLYASCGITDNFGVILALPYISASPDAGFWSTQSGLQDFSAAVSWRPFTLDVGDLGKVNLIASAGISVPVAKYVNDAPIAIGHGSTNTDARLLAHYTTSFGLFATVNAGYIHRSNVDLDKGFETAVPDAVDFAAKLGYAGPDYYGALWIHNQNAQSGTDIAPSAVFPSNAVSFMRVGVDLHVPLPFVVKGFGVALGGATTLSGRNVGKSTRFSFGLTYGVDLF